MRQLTVMTIQGEIKEEKL